MNVLIALEMVPDLDRLRDEDWVVHDHDRIDTGFVLRRLDSDAESALELALRLRDDCEPLGHDVALSALTIGDAAADPVLRTLLALRFSAATRLAWAADLRFAARAVAAAIVDHVRESGHVDVVLLGRRTGEGGDARTPALVAEALGWPCVGEVVAVVPTGDGHLRVTSRCAGGSLVHLLRAPCVLVVGDVAGAALRRPTLQDRRLFGRRPITVIDVSPPDFYDDRPDRLTPVHRSRAVRMIDGADAVAAARTLWHDHLKTRLKAP